MILKNASGTKVGEFDFDSVRLGNYKAKCLEFKEELKITIIRVSALNGYTITLDGGKVFTLSGAEHEILAQLKNLGIEFDNDGFITLVAVETYEDADPESPNKVNVIVIIGEDQVEVKFDRNIKVPKVKDVIAALQKDETFVTVAEESEFEGLALAANGEALKNNFKFVEDTTVYALFHVDTPQEEAPAALTDDDFEAVDPNSDFDPTLDYYTKNATTGEYEIAEIESFAEGVTYYTLKPVDETPAEVPPVVDPNA